ncbi:IS3 family transposase [Xenorhabdus khoisanae]|uniref:IS3 family transposase n=2 Tax=Xenorhabdus khoisanae TaxID=880157 RepID=UPI0009080A90|nr:IS3 family transposase [Xenorhabdus khoisanae]
MSRSAYYDWQHRGVDGRRLALRSRIRELHQESRGAAGSRTLSALLKVEGKVVGRYLARRLMKEGGLESCQPDAHRYRRYPE